MKTLADLKKKVTQGVTDKTILVKTNVMFQNQTHLEPKPYTTVEHVQSNSFSLNREGKKSWVEFGKASQYEFTELTAKLNYPKGGYMLITFNK